MNIKLIFFWVSSLSIAKPSNDMTLFEILLLRLIVSNGLPFTFVENEEIIAIFQFIAPEYKALKSSYVIQDFGLLGS